jgi:hypothetical protein
MPLTKQESKKWLLLTASVLFYLSSLALPAVVTVKDGGKTEAIEGIFLFLFGPIAPVLSKPICTQFGWYANIYFAGALIDSARRRWQRAYRRSIYAVLVALNTLAWLWFPIAADEAAATYSTLKHPHLGFFAWLLSMVFVLVLARDKVREETGEIPESFLSVLRQWPGSLLRSIFMIRN